jgi:hypothetical protein
VRSTALAVVEHVIGVDIHRDSHAAAVLDPTGGLVAQVEIPGSQQGDQQLLRLVGERAPGRRCWALEGRLLRRRVIWSS